VSKVRERLGVGKQAMQRFHMQRFNLENLNEVEGKEQYRVEMSNTLAALENVDAEVDVNRAWETTKKNIKISAKESVGYYRL
jgi:ABC-type hemin transport system ATPase subunit